MHHLSTRFMRSNILNIIPEIVVFVVALSTATDRLFFVLCFAFRSKMMQTPINTHTVSSYLKHRPNIANFCEYAVRFQKIGRATYTLFLVIGSRNAIVVISFPSSPTVFAPPLSLNLCGFPTGAIPLEALTMDLTWRFIVPCLPFPTSTTHSVNAFRTD